MALVDEVRIHAQAGHGGPGVTRWLHIRGQDKGGPAGGDGGRGGDIILEGVRDLSALATFRFTKKFRAENGKPGGNDNKHGKDAEPIVLKVPVGTVAKIVTTGQIYEIISDGQREVVFKGGPGGYGNAHFKSSTNQNPLEVTKGKPGGVGDIEITLKLIADAGLIGFPNAGKSSLLNALTRAQSKVGAYPFTTLDPHLGDLYGFLLADIPGLIEGASSGRGLGSKFLRHVERTGLLIHLVSAEQEDVAASYRAIRKELEAFGRGLPEKPELIVLSKSDMLSPEEQGKALAALAEASNGGEVTSVSIIDDDALKAFSDRLTSLLKSKA
ncbi:MAG TPA: GTPase ObgE [Candidatus Paceibacterota bacterium]|nr:GTPase ObgE [Candidatus Paceibacterota bacterium]